MKLVIPYYRASTEKQGRSRLGLEAQQHEVRHYCNCNQLHILMEIIEVRSTRKRRVRLEEAFNLCKKHKAALIVYRICRLGRDVEEIAHNIKLPIDIIVVDNPNANRFTIHIIAAVAEEERRKTSENTKLALQAAKRRGVQLGQNGKVLAIKNKIAANEFAKKLQPLITKLNAEGIYSTRKIATELNRLNIPTFSGNARWHRTSVWNVLHRLKRLDHLIKNENDCKKHQFLKNKMKINPEVKDLVKIQNTATLVLPFNTIKSATPYTQNIAGAGTVIIQDEELSIIVHRVDAPFLGFAEGALEVRGEGMEPTYPSGCIVSIIRMVHKEIIDWGSCYFIIDKNHHGTVRRVYQGERENSLRLVCDNENQNLFPPIQRHWDHIEMMFIIKSKIFKQ